MVFFDTTSIHFTGKGGETLGANGHSKDHRPDLKLSRLAVQVEIPDRILC